jgi:uncharacterized protein YndB with AHSA1/START domain
MGIATKASIVIDAPRDEVFRWITERDKLTTWMGGAGAMPADSAELKVGFTAQGTMVAPGGERPTTLTVTAWDPPSTFGCTIVYPGGDSLSTYTLTSEGSGTRLELASDTDWAAVDDSAADKALEGQPDWVHDLVEHQLENLKAKLLQGAFDGTAQPGMQKSVEDSLAKLKTLVEAG